MLSRQEYQKRYYAKHRRKINERRKKYYRKHKKQSLIKQRKHYINNRDIILFKKRIAGTSFPGRIDAVYPPILKYGKKWLLPVCSQREFTKWATDDPTYNKLHKEWVDSGFLSNLAPVAMRRVKKNGFVTENLYWDTKSKYSWWNEDIQIYKEVEEELNDYQKAHNKSNKEFRKKLREQWKAKQKEKRK